jgi:hypothetical protein
MAIAKLPKATAGRPAEKNRDQLDPISQPSRTELAEEAGIGRTTMKRADKVNEQGAKAVKDAVIAGDVSVSDAASIVDLPKAEQAKAVKEVKSGKAKTLKAAAKKPKKETEEPDLAALAKKNKSLAHSYRDKLARAICDYHEVCPNRSERDRLVKIVQGIQLW